MNGMSIGSSEHDVQSGTNSPDILGEIVAKESILIVEDELADVLSAFLRGFGFLVTATVDTGEAAIDIVGAPWPVKPTDTSSSRLMNGSFTPPLKWPSTRSVKIVPPAIINKPRRQSSAA